MTAPTGVRWRLGGAAFAMGRKAVQIVAELPNGGQQTVAVVLASHNGAPMSEADRATAELVASARELLAELSATVAELERFEATYPNRLGAPARVERIEAARALLARFDEKAREGA